MPAEYTDFVGLYDDFMFWSIIVGIIVFVWMLYSVLRFRQGMVDESTLEKLEPGTFPKDRDSMTAEMAWTIVPSILVAWLCVLSWGSLYDAWGQTPDDDEAFVVSAVATQWNWAFTYEDPIVVEDSSDSIAYSVHIAVSDSALIIGTTDATQTLTVKWSNGPASGEFNTSGSSTTVNTAIDMQELLEIDVKDSEGNLVHEYVRYAVGTGGSGEVFIPCGEEIKFKLNSEKVGDADAVLHSFFLPEWAIKEDVVPNLETVVYFTPLETGTYDVVCAEYCGMRHAYMKAKITVIASDICGGDA